MAKQGPTIHSTYEICRLVFFIAHVTYSAFDITMQALCAAYIGLNQKSTAKAILLRTLQASLRIRTFLKGFRLCFG